MHEFGTTPEQLAHVSATIRNHGHVNPEAVMFGAGPYTIADVLASPLIATPFHRLDEEEVRIGMGLRVRFEEVAKEVWLPRFAKA